MGVHKKIESPELLWSLFEDYKKHVKSRPRLEHDFVGKDAVSVRREKEVPLTLERFECWVADLGIIGQLTHYFVNWENRYENFVTVCARIKLEIRADQIEGGMCGQYNPSITQRLNGLVDKMEMNDEKHTIDLSDLPDELIEQIIEAQRTNARNVNGGKV